MVETEFKVGDRVTFAASPGSRTRYRGTIVALNGELATVSHEDYIGATSCVAVRKLRTLKDG